MYVPFFGLKREPFSIAPDPRALFMSERHREALAHLLYGLNAGGGFVLLTGEIGAGKTTVCRCFLEQVPKRCNVAYIFNPKLTVEELLRTICDEFGVPPPSASAGLAGVAPPTVKDYVDPLNQYLLKTHAVGQNNVLIIDEAQNLSADVLEQLRLLTNLETSERKLLQIVLIGQPELRDMLAQPALEQLAQRVVARFHLEALSEAETAQYITHRLAVAGITTASPFDAAAMRRIHRIARGVPRRINLLCDRALLGAYASGKSRVDRRIIDQAAAEAFDADHRRRGRSPDSWNPRFVAWGAVGGVLAGATLYGVATSALLPAVSAPGSTSTLATAAANAASGGRSSGDGLRVANAANAVTARAASAASTAGSTANPRPASSAAALPTSASPAVAAASASLNAPLDTNAFFAALPRTEGEAWRALAPLWQLTLADGDPCQAALRQQVQCFRGNVEPALIRRLNRPGILTLHDGAGRTAYALLTGLDGQSATLRTAGGVQTLPLVTLARWWRGDFATFWRAPPGYTGMLASGNAGPAVDWIATTLAALRREPPPAGAQTFDEALRSRLIAFQLANELRPDGIAGPTTFMQLMRASGVDEPRVLAAATPP